MDYNFVIVSNDWFRNNKHIYSNEELLLFALLQKNMLFRNRNIIFNLDWIYRQFNIKSNDSARQKRIRKSLYKFYKNSIFSFDTDVLKVNKNILIYGNMTEIENNYTMIRDSELDTILQSSFSIEEKRNIFACFCNIKSRIDEKNYCYPSISEIANNTNCSEKSVINYIHILKDELKLILVGNPGNRVFNNKIVKQSNNIYVMNYVGHEKYLDIAIYKYKKQLAEYNIKLVKNKNANKKRSESMKKYWAKQKGENKKDSKYGNSIFSDKDIEEVQELLDMGHDPEKFDMDEYIIYDKYLKDPYEVEQLLS